MSRHLCYQYISTLFQLFISILSPCFCLWYDGFDIASPIVTRHFWHLWLLGSLYESIFWCYECMLNAACASCNYPCPQLILFTIICAQCTCTSHASGIHLMLLLASKILGCPLIFRYYFLLAFINGSLCLIHCQYCLWAGSTLNEAHRHFANECHWRGQTQARECSDYDLTPDIDHGCYQQKQIPQPQSVVSIVFVQHSTSPCQQSETKYMYQAATMQWAASWYDYDMRCNYRPCPCIPCIHTYHEHGSTHTGTCQTLLIHHPEKT